MAFSRFLRTLLRSQRSSNCIFADTSLSVSSQNNTNTPTAHIGSRRIFDGYTDCALFRFSIPENYSFPFKKTTLHVTCKTNISLLLLRLSAPAAKCFSTACPNSTEALPVTKTCSPTKVSVPSPAADVSPCPAIPSSIKQKHFYLFHKKSVHVVRMSRLFPFTPESESLPLLRKRTKAQGFLPKRLFRKYTLAGNLWKSPALASFSGRTWSPPPISSQKNEERSSKCIRIFLDTPQLCTPIRLPSTRNPQS